jgi:DNA invertase Pin-like site-specific DNA recombinase
MILSPAGQETSEVAMSDDISGVRRSERAVQYVRMSTDPQQNSIQNQDDAIAAYAERRGLTVVRTYRDEGRSGLVIKGRDGLQELIDDVQSGRADFGNILVYDVTRWGRFQDADESAYYEFICKRAGIAVHYCADEFENDGSFASAIIKTAKRLAAADFSKMLSKRVFMGQSRIVTMGFWPGGVPSYGLRRQMVDEHGDARMLLERGQWKNLQTDRCVLKPGPASEVKTVKRIFRSFVILRKTTGQIAAELNDGHIFTTRGYRWTSCRINKILTNESYVGKIVFNRMSRKLQQKLVANPPEMWIRRDGALEAIIDPNLFAKAQAIMSKRARRMSDEDALDRLRDLWRKKGYLSVDIIAASDEVPHESLYFRRFGSLTAAYKQIGFQPTRHYHWKEIHQRVCLIISEAIAEIVSTIEKLGGHATFDPATQMLSIGEGRLTVSIGSARSVYDGRRRVRWHVKIDRHRQSDFALVFRMDSFNVKVMDYFLLPFAELAQCTTKDLCVSRRSFSRSSHHDTLDAFYRICAAHVKKPNLPCQ